MLDWRAAFGVSDRSLSDAGRTASRRAADDLAAFLGPTWLWRAAQRPAAERPELAVLSSGSPAGSSASSASSASLAEPDGAAVFLDAISLWASLRLLVEHRVQGIAKLRGNLARNPGRDEFRHGATQARLAAQALLAGARPVLEPPVGDVLVHDDPMRLRADRPGPDLLLELRGLNRAGPGTARRLVRAVELKAKQTRSVPAAWVWIEDGGALWSLPGFGDRPARERIDLVAEALDRVFATWPHLCGVVLAETPSPPLPAASSASPVVSSASAAALPVASASLVAPASPAISLSGSASSAASLAASTSPVVSISQSRSPAASLSPSAASSSSLVAAGLSSSPAAALSRPVAVAATERHDRGAAFLRVLPGDRVRETVVVHRPALAAVQFALVHRLCAEEPAWLDAALAHLGLPGGVAALLDQNSGVNTAW
ncbi:hypothetical protein [Dactylosporangium sp. NPDC051484]|uniref:hypothetical protein n=1 Tax=Dactylosporangium sp. NPDC051484 TaxID=3154942 RepID=UPI003450F265